MITHQQPEVLGVGVELRPGGLLHGVAPAAPGLPLERLHRQVGWSEPDPGQQNCCKIQ